MSRRQRQLDEIRALCAAGWPVPSTWRSSTSPASGATRVIDLLAEAIEHAAAAEDVRGGSRTEHRVHAGPGTVGACWARLTAVPSIHAHLAARRARGARATTARPWSITGAKQRALLVGAGAARWAGGSGRPARRGAVGRGPAAGRPQRAAGTRVEAATGARFDRARRHARRRLRARHPPEAVDVHRFEQLVAQGRAAAPAAISTGARRLLAEADAMWRGDALAEFAYEEFASATTTRLSELRLAAIEERLDAELQLGRAGMIGELESLVAAHPLRERLRGLLMLALYRAGRQAEALRALPGRSSASSVRSWASTRTRSCAGWRPRSSPRTRRSMAPAASEAGARASGPRSTIPAPLTPLVGARRRAARVSPRSPASTASSRWSVREGWARPGWRSRWPRPPVAALSDGACLVELAPVGDPAAVRSAITAALGLPDARPAGGDDRRPGAARSCSTTAST